MNFVLISFLFFFFFSICFASLTLFFLTHVFLLSSVLSWTLSSSDSKFSSFTLLNLTFCLTLDFLTFLILILLFFLSSEELEFSLKSRSSSFILLFFNFVCLFFLSFLAFFIIMSSFLSKVSDKELKDETESLELKLWNEESFSLSLLLSLRTCFSRLKRKSLNLLVDFIIDETQRFLKSLFLFVLMFLRTLSLSTANFEDEK